MFKYGGNVLAEAPKRFLTEDTILVYRNSVKEFASRYGGTDYVQVAAITESRLCVWSFMIVENEYEFNLLIEQFQGWEAFAQVPDIFLQLGTKFTHLEDINTRYTTDQVVTMLEKHGAVKQVS